MNDERGTKARIDLRFLLNNVHKSFAVSKNMGLLKKSRGYGGFPVKVQIFPEKSVVKVVKIFYDRSTMIIQYTFPICMYLL